MCFPLQVKRTAPGMGALQRGDFDVVEFSRGLEGAGVSAIAVNTDRKFFGCSYEDLTSIRVNAISRLRVWRDREIIDVVNHLLMENALAF